MHMSWDEEKEELRHASVTSDGGSLDKQCDGLFTQQSLLLL